VGVFHSTSNKPTNLALFAQAFSSSPKLVQGKIFFRLLLELCSIGVNTYLTSSSNESTPYSHTNMQPLLADLFSLCASY